MIQTSMKNLQKRGWRFRMLCVRKVGFDILTNFDFFLIFVLYHPYS